MLGLFVDSCAGSHEGLDGSVDVTQDLNELGAEAWVYWQAIENGDSVNWWGLIQVPFHGGAWVQVSSRFESLQHCSVLHPDPVFAPCVYANAFTLLERGGPNLNSTATPYRLAINPSTNIPRKGSHDFCHLIP